LLDADEPQRMRPLPFNFHAQLNRFPDSLEKFRNGPGMRMATLQIRHLRNISTCFILSNQYSKCLLSHFIYL